MQRIPEEDSRKNAPPETALRVAIPWLDEEPEFEAELRPRLDANVVLTRTTDEDPVDVLVAGRPTREQLERLRPRYLVIPFAGVPYKTLELMREFPAIDVHNLHHNAAPTAELALALLLAVAKHIVPIDRSFRAADWSSRYGPSSSLLLAGRRALIVGYGAIGRRIGSACEGLGMDTRWVRRQRLAADDPARVFPIDELHSVLPGAEVLILAVPGIAGTLIGERELALLPAGALLINVARGGIVDERALYEALASGRLGGAGIDVWYRYPQSREERTNTAPSEFSFGELDNVVISPHRAGDCDRTEWLRAEHLAALLNAAARGHELANRVDLELGY